LHQRLNQRGAAVSKIATLRKLTSPAFSASEYDALTNLLELSFKRFVEDRRQSALSSAGFLTSVR